MSSATSTLKKLAARLRLIPSTSDCDTAVASFQDEKKLDRLETQSQDRSQSTAKKGKAPAISGGPNCCNCCNCSKNGLPSLPDPDLSFKAYDQTWDYEKDEWTDIFRIPKMGNASLTNRVIAYDRKDGRRPHKDHIWIEHMATDENPQIKWNLLWALFAPDSLVETPESMSSLGMAFKLDSWGYTSSQTLNESEFEIEGEILEWTGFRYAPVPMRRTIMYYTGMRPVKVLSVKPLAEARKSQFTERGRKYIELAGIRHLHYQTHVMWREYDSHGQEVARKERADGRVMIDAMSFRRFNPGMDQWDVEELSENSPYQDSAGVNQCPSEPELCLLPPTAFGWSFTAKKWGQFVLERLSPIPFEKNAFHNLVLPEDDKHLIKSLVEAQTGMAKGALFEDMIKGKGCGLVLLLHGNPGTGKTLTAEAISEHLQLPLYNVSCSEFGTDLKTVETKLKQILEITSLWKAVVLINEADIFLEARCDDLQRSSIVGVFLRVLEYHSGIVILTTNRVRTLDQAFKSRISVALKYKDLDFDSRKGLWMKFLSFAGSTIETLGEPDSNYDFSQEDMNTLSEREINGRVIKHVVRTAQALAFSGEERLKIRHIHRVWGILDAFEADLQAENEDMSSKKMS